MDNKEEIVRVYTGDLVTVEHIKNELEANDIYPVVENGYQEGLDAGIIAGTPSTIHLYVLESEVKSALKIIKDIIGQNT